MANKSGAFGASMADSVAAKGEDLAELVAQTTERGSDGIPEASDSVGMAAAELSERASQVKEQVSRTARTAMDRIDGGRSTTADGLETAASALRGKADHLPGGEKVSEVAHATADRLSTTADYVRTRDINGMSRDVVTLVKNNPGPSLLVGAVFGFLLGRAMNRD